MVLNVMTKPLLKVTWHTRYACYDSYKLISNFAFLILGTLELLMASFNHRATLTALHNTRSDDAGMPSTSPYWPI